MNKQQQVCAYCGKPLESGAMFCGYCGTPVQAETAPGYDDGYAAEPRQDPYEWGTPDPYGGDVYDPQDDGRTEQYPSDPGYPAGDDYDYDSAETYPPQSDYGYAPSDNRSVRQRGRQRQVEPDEPDDDRESRRNKKIVTVVLCITAVILVIEGVFAYLYLNDITSSFFPVREVIGWVKGEDDEQTTAPEEAVTQPQPDRQQGYAESTAAASFTVPGFSLTTTTAPETTTSPEPITGEPAAQDNLQPYLGSATPANRLYVVNTQFSNLNMRQAPNTEADVVEEIPKDTVINIQYIYGTWGYVEYRGTGGWVSMNFLEVYN